MPDTMAKEIQGKYRRLIKGIRKLAGSGTPIEDHIFKTTQMLYVREHPEIPSVFQYHHHGLLLIKLIILYYPQTARSKVNFRDRDCSEFINPVIDLSSSIHDLRMAPEPEQQSKKYWLEIFRAASFQQFYLQQFCFGRYLISSELDRQQVIFSSKQTLKEAFEELSGMSVDDFTQISKACAELLNRQQRITETCLSGLPKAGIFLSCISRTKRQLKAFLEEEDKSIRESLQKYRLTTHERPLWGDPRFTQFWERSPLLRYPLLHVDNYYYCYSPFLLQSTLSNFMYTFLKEKIGNTLKQNDYLGGALELYVDKGLAATFDKGCLWLDGQENGPETKRRFGLGNNDKITDFLVTDGKNILLIEVKAQDPRKKVSTVMLDSSRYGLAPIIEAVEQGYSTGKWIRDRGPQNIGGLDIPIPDRLYLIVLTYEEFYIGTGSNLSEIEDLTKLDDEYGHQLRKEDIFCLSVSEFDLFLEKIRRDGRSVFDALEFASRSVLHGDTERMTVFLEGCLTGYFGHRAS